MGTLYGNRPTGLNVPAGSPPSGQFPSIPAPVSQSGQFPGKPVANAEAGESPDMD